jgi:hypothetical protein
MASIVDLVGAPISETISPDLINACARAGSRSSVFAYQDTTGIWKPLIDLNNVREAYFSGHRIIAAKINYA